MFTSIFRKLLTSYITVIVIGFTLLAILLNVELKSFLIQQRAVVLNRAAQVMTPLLQEVNEDPSLYPLFEKQVNRYQNIYHLDWDLVLTADEEGLKSIPKINQRLTKRTQVLNAKVVEKVLQGKRTQNVGAFKKTDNEITLTIGVPLKKNGQTIGALFLHTPVQEIQMGQVTKLILAGAGIVLMLSIFVLYFISRKISQPLIRMNRAAHLIGEGNFKERIPIESRDEVGQLAQTFNQMAVQLEKLENMRKDLISNVSHELRTPLTSIKGFVQGIMEGVIPPDQQQRYIEISFKELNRLSTLLNTMLDLSAIESGRITLNLVSIRWSSLVDSIGDSLKLRMDEKNIDFILDSEEGISVWGDPERLKQVLFNLLDNAIRHTPNEGTISIASKKAQHQLEVRVFNSGEGIDPEKLNLIWERFFTEESSRTSRQERSGLGLTITKHLVEMMKGNIQVESKQGIGTTFIIHLPLTPAS